MDIHSTSTQIIIRIPLFCNSLFGENAVYIILIIHKRNLHFNEDSEKVPNFLEKSSVLYNV